MQIQIRANRKDGKVKLKNIPFDGLTQLLNIPNEQSEKSSQESGFKFDFIEAKRNGSNVTCLLKITSLDDDGELIIYGTETKVYDENGIEVKVASLKLGNESHPNRVGIDYTFVQGVQTPLKLTFKNVSSVAKGISLLQIQIRANRKDGKVKLKNIPFDGLTQLLNIPNEQSEKSSQESGFKFDFIEAKRNGSNVTCLLKITSLDDDGELIIYGTETKVYDENGIEVKVTSLKLGNESHPNRVGIDYTFVQGVQTPLKLTFKNVSSVAKGISLLQIQIRANRKDGKVKLKNIDIVQ